MASTKPDKSAERALEEAKQRAASFAEAHRRVHAAKALLEVGLVPMEDSEREKLLGELDAELAAHAEPVRWGDHRHAVLHDHGPPHYMRCDVCGRVIGTRQLAPGRDVAESTGLICGNDTCKAKHEQRAGG